LYSECKANNDFKFQKTSYPKIYEGSYWGNHRVSVDTYGPLDQIVINRNNFVKTYNITKKYEIPCRYYTLSQKFVIKEERDSKYNYFRDHIEHYKSGKQTICIFSQHVRSEKEKNIIESNGYTEIPPMYRTSSQTYMKIV
jgi:hypothetical protein